MATRRFRHEARARFFFACMLCVWFGSSRSFDSLEQAKRYAARVPEAVESDSPDWVDPEFSTAYHAIAPGYISQIASYLGLYEPLWDITHFVERLRQVTQQRNNVIPERYQERELSLPRGAQIIVFGDLHGAFHSCVRTLDELRQRELLDDQLRIQKSDVYIVIVGDAISRSPYSLQTLTLILDLMYRNPDNVIYLRGNHESDEYWQNFSMRRALKYFAASYTSSNGDAIPLSQECCAFFSTLPKRCLWYPRDDSKNCAYIAHNRDSHKGFVQRRRVQAELGGERRLQVLGATKGLEFIGFAFGFSSWSLLSCPVYVYQKYFHFHHDSCVIAHVDSDVTDTVLEHVHRDVTGHGDFVSDWYDMVLGIPVDGPDGRTQDPVIPFGLSAHLTGRLRSLGRSVLEGIEQAVMRSNTEKDQAFYARPIALDDKYAPRLARKNAEKLHDKYSIDSFVIPISSATLASYYKQYPDVGIFFPLTGAPRFRTPDADNIVHFRASYVDETRALIDYMIRRYSVRRLALFYEQNEYGSPPAEEARRYLKEKGITDWIDVPYTAAQADFSREAQKLRSYNPEAIACFSSSTPTQELISATGIGFFLGKPLFGISGLEDEAFQLFQKSRGLHTIFSYVVPNPKNDDRALVREYRRAMDIAGAPYDSNSLEGYLAVRLFQEALNATKPPRDPKKLIAFYESLKDYPFHGFTLTFDPKTRSLGQPVWINDEGVWQKIEK